VRSHTGPCPSEKEEVVAPLLLDCEVGPVAGPPRGVRFLGFGFGGFCLPFSCWFSFGIWKDSVW
jgi:hypothetical protein